MKVSVDTGVGQIVMIDGTHYLVEDLSINVHLVAQRIEPLRDKVMALEPDEALAHAPVFYQFSAPWDSEIVREIVPLVPKDDA